MFLAMAGRLIVAAVSFVVLGSGVAHADIPVTRDIDAGWRELLARPRVPRVVYSTYFGGSDWETPGWSTLTRDGSFYVTGVTSSSDFPTTAGAFRTLSIGGMDGFVAKLDRDGRLMYSTYLGGTGDDVPLGIAIDSRGAAYIVGYTSSRDFPVTAGALQPSFAGGTYDAFAVKLSPDGSRLEYSTYLGGSDDDFAYIGPLDRWGHLHVMGYTYSADFPVTAGAAQTVHAGAADAFVTKLDASGSELVYSTFVGGSGEDQGWDGNIDEDGNIYLDGFTTSADFPITPGAFQKTQAGGTDAFVLKLSKNGSRLVWSSYLGGTGDEYVSDLALGADGNVYVSGNTSSTDFPVTTNAAQLSYGGGSGDGFIAKIDRSGRKVLYATYVGGNGWDVVGGIRVDACGDMFIHGTTGSTDLPMTPDALQSQNLGPNDLFVMKLHRDGQVGYSTYFGGSGDDFAWGAGSSLDAQGNYHFAGNSCSTDFPTTANAYQRYSAGGCDVVFSVVSLGDR